MALPSDMTITHLDAGTKDPKQARAELATNAGKFNSLLAHMILSPLLQFALNIGDGLENVGNTHVRLRDGLTVKRKGTNGPPEVALGYAAKTGAYTAVAADRGTLIDCTANTFTVTLTAPATLGADWWCMVRNSGTGTITVDPASTALIDGSATLTLREDESAIVVCTGSAFKTVGRGGGGGGGVDFQRFTVSGIWSKPADATFVMGIGWGAGGGGSSAGNDAGGGGGACALGFWRASDLAATEAVQIGAGGSGSSGVGGVGGNTVFDKLIAYGGAGGGLNTGAGGGGGGWLSAGSMDVGAIGDGGGPDGGIASSGERDSSFGGGAGGGGNSAFGGGGGGNTSGSGGKSVFGGGGGGQPGGTSVFGGNGGGASENGQAPGGGGGRGATSGARGELWVITW